MQRQKSLASNTVRKRKILVGCAIGGTALIMAGGGIGVGYAIWYSKNSGGKESVPTSVVIQQQNIDTQAALNTSGSYQFIATDNLGRILTESTWTIVQPRITDLFTIDNNGKLTWEDSLDPDTSYNLTIECASGALAVGSTNINIEVSVTPENDVIPYSKLLIEGDNLKGFKDPYEEQWGRKLVIPSYVLYIDDDAFIGCWGLTSVISSVTKIGKSAFQDCYGLQNITTGMLTSIGESSFSYCTSLSVIDLGDVESIPNYAFEHCENLFHYWSNGLINEIGEYAFQFCESLFNSGSNALTNLGEYAFYHCTSMTDAILGDVEFISAFAFEGCMNLRYISCLATTIDSNAFAECNNLISITSLATTIKETAFLDCKSLKNITTGTLTSIGTNAFQGCTNLTPIELSTLLVDDDNLIKTNYPTTGNPIGVTIKNKSDNKIAGCLAVGKITSTSIPDHAFEGCASLTSIASTTTTIGNNAFQGCYGLQNITTGTLTSIGTNAFQGCTNLKQIDLGDVSTIPVMTFFGCASLISVVAPLVTEIHSRAFQGCYGLQNITTGTLTSIGDFATFSDCASLESIDLGTVTWIGWDAFNGCSNLMSVSSSSSVTQIGSAAFLNCVSLQGIATGDLTSIGDYAFYNCASLTVGNLSGLKVSTASNYSVTRDLDGVAVTDKSSGEIVGCLAVGKITSTSIPDRAFEGCASLTSITSTTTTIGFGAFALCSNLQDVDVVNLTQISDRAFYGCSNLQNIKTGVIEWIAWGVFEGCRSVGNVDIPSGSTPWNENPDLMDSLGPLMTWTYNEVS